MESDSKFRQWMTSTSEWLNEQEWFQQLKGKWEELDPQSRTYLKAGGAGAGVLFVLIMIISSVWSVHSLKSELSDKQDLLSMIQSANEELRTLREQTPTPPAAGGGAATSTWTSYFESLVTPAGFEKGALTVSADKPGQTTDQAKESLFDLNLKHVSIKHIVRFAFGLENGARPVKLRNLAIDTHADPAGYMDATLSVSAFAMISK